MEKVRGLTLLILAIMMALASIGVFGESGKAAQDLPKPREILDRYVKALGGADAITKHKSRTRKGILTMPSGKTASVVEYLAPFKILTKVTTAGGDFIQAADGNVAWVSNPKGAMLVRPFVQEFWKREADLSYPIHVTDYFHSFDTVGIEEFEGRACFHIKGVTNWGDRNEQFYDKQTGLLAGYRFPSDNSKDAPLSVLAFADYKEFGGLLVPSKEISREFGSTTTTTYTSITFDDVDDAVFALPAALQQQINGPKSK
ncbi:MAG TPA: hypothetical protein VJX67_15755 [Blastocatellia bacterium]|nr:hypothetical protein [Blastocatellia bacterium]